MANNVAILEFVVSTSPLPNFTPSTSNTMTSHNTLPRGRVRRRGRRPSVGLGRGFGGFGIDCEVDELRGQGINLIGGQGLDDERAREAGCCGWSLC
jgi:hypothetical protein